MNEDKSAIEQLAREAAERIAGWYATIMVIPVRKSEIQVVTNIITDTFAAAPSQPVWDEAIRIVKLERHGKALHREWSQVHHDTVDRIVAALESAKATFAAAPSRLVELAQAVIDEAGNCDDCENVALWDRWDDPETHWETCDEHKGDSLGFEERKRVRLALAALATTPRDEGKSR